MNTGCHQIFECIEILQSSLGPDDYEFTDETLALIVGIKTYRMDVCFQPDYFNLENIKPEILAWLPRSTLPQLEQGYKKGNPRLSIQYADCLQYGLRGAKRDLKKAFAVYRELAAKGQAEAMVAASQIYFDRFKENFDKDPDVDGIRIPRNFEYTSNGPLLRKMWQMLEKTADIGWKSFFLYHQALGAEATDSWKLTPSVKALLEEMKRDQDEQ
jgi:TPR repeat protein